MYEIANTTSGVLYVGTSEYAPGSATGPVDLAPGEVAELEAAGLTVTPYAQPFYTGQVKITTTGTPVQLPSFPDLSLGVAVTAKSTNAALATNAVACMGSSSAVTNTFDGGATGKGYPLPPGSTSPLAGVDNADQIWVNGTAGDEFAFLAS